jgi:murein DD-endopeptidase MepM/ murein hydrolase activator NlpD
MRSGIAHTHDLGLGQSHTTRSFGNYITIDHGDGEFSHYAHLATGSFQIRDGQHVEAGTVLARAGNSGYTFGQSGGHHLHVHVTRALRIGSPSIPFEFADWPGARRLASSGGAR